MAKHPVVHLEISATDPKAAGEFYGALFGWKIEVDERFDYVQFMGEDSGIGGAFVEVGDTYKAGQILPYVQVPAEEIESFLEKADGLGGKTARPKTEIPGVGWFAILVDPTGNAIGLFAGGGPPEG